MDPLAHTLAGAALAETRLRSATALAAPALILGANAPDIDAITMFLDRDVTLGFRRGWTHGILALVVLPALLTLALIAFDRVRGRWRGTPSEVRGLPLLGICTLAVASHPALDWLNTYGVRLLMPFDGTWFYGDALFVIDPYLWIVFGAPGVLARSASVGGACAWLLLGAATTYLAVGFEGGAPGTRVLWCAGLATIVLARARGWWRERVSAVAAICLAVGAAYIASMVAASRIAERQVEEWLADRGARPGEVLASPAAGNPMRHEMVAAYSDRYRFLDVNWLADPPIREAGPPIDRGSDGPIVAAALTAPHVRGLANWLRFPAYRIEETPNGYRVLVADVRYARRPGGGLGGAVVELDRELRVLGP